MELLKAAAVLVVLVCVAGDISFPLDSVLKPKIKRCSWQADKWRSNQKPFVETAFWTPLQVFHWPSVDNIYLSLFSLFRIGDHLWLFSSALWPLHPLPGVDHTHNTHDDHRIHNNHSNKGRVSWAEFSSSCKSKENLETLWTNSQPQHGHTTSDNLGS